MLFRLAARSGRTVREMAEALGADELVEWHEYWDLEPFGCEAQQLAALCAMFANVHRSKSAAPVDPERFLPNYDPNKPQDVEQIKAVFMRAFSVVNQQQQQPSAPPRAKKDIAGMHLGSKLED